MALEDGSGMEAPPAADAGNAGAAAPIAHQ
jgi:hypothetical protein